MGGEEAHTLKRALQVAEGVLLYRRRFLLDAVLASFLAVGYAFGLTLVWGFTLYTGLGGRSSLLEPTPQCILDMVVTVVSLELGPLLLVLAERRSRWLREHLEQVTPHNPLVLLPASACFGLGMVLAMLLLAAGGLEPVPAILLGYIARRRELRIVFPFFHITWPLAVTPMAARLYASSKSLGWRLGAVLALTASLLAGVAWTPPLAVENPGIHVDTLVMLAITILLVVAVWGSVRCVTITPRED